MKAIINGKIILKDRVLDDSTILYDDKIVELKNSAFTDTSEMEVIDAKGNYVAPGLVDMHIHGYLGEDTSDGKIEGLKKMASGIVSNGVTSWCPTTMTVAKSQIEKAFDTVRELKKDKSYYGAKVLGVNCEGPFINPAKKGAQAEEHILKPDASFIKKHQDIIKVFTMAPEMDDDFKCIKEIYNDTNVLISMGHTSATFEQAEEAVRYGVRHATHLFNAMTPLQHRAPGVVGAAFSSDNVTTELIADTFHVNPNIFELIYRIKGDNLILITDCIRAGGLNDGEYDLGGQKVSVKGIHCLLDNGTIAGSVLKLNIAIRNMMTYTDAPIYKIVRSASLNPAKAIHEDNKIGSIEIGKNADLIIANKNFDILKTIIGGEIRYEC